MRGTKHKIKIEEIENKSSKMVTFTKRRDGLYRKLSKLCDLFPETKFAFLAEPVSSNSHAAFYSFGHPSVDRVVSSLLSGQPPLPENREKSSGLGFWWEDKGFDTSEDVDDLNEAPDAVSRMLNNVRLRVDDVVKSNQKNRSLVIRHHQHPEETTTNQVPLLEGETSDPPNNLLTNEENTLQTDDFYSVSDYDIDLPF